MFEWLNKIFHRKPSPCDNCDAPMLTRVGFPAILVKMDVINM
nr:MAG TPA: hypothetical protein [Caudoviricetes sp.]